MLNSKGQHDIEQAMAFFREFYPASCWAMYQGSIDAGFTDEQAFRLTTTWLLAQVQRPSEPPTTND